MEFHFHRRRDKELEEQELKRLAESDKRRWVEREMQATGCRESEALCRWRDGKPDLQGTEIEF